MKILKFTTSHGDFALMDGTEQIDKTLKSLLDEYIPVAKVSEMTEEQLGEVVEWNETHQFYPDYRIKDYSWYGDLTASESFSTLVHSLGWYLWENPVQVSIASLPDKEQVYRQLDADWQEAESKTLYSPILMKKI